MVDTIPIGGGKSWNEDENRFITSHQALPGGGLDDISDYRIEVCHRITSFSVLLLGARKIPFSICVRHVSNNPQVSEQHQ